jgi:hypothetical protein
MSASTLATATFSNDTDAHFRTWVAAFIAAIVAGGWVQTSDTGQINTSTVLAPVATNTVAGYAIFRSNDTGGSLNEFYVKLEFGSGGTSALRPAVWITVAWASDGAGNLVSTTYPISTRAQIATGTNPASFLNINMASGSGYFCIVACPGTAETLIVSVERTRDATNAFQNQILTIGTTAGSWTGAFCQTITRLNAYPNVADVNIGTNVVIPPVGNTPIAGIVGLGIIFGMAPGPTSPSLNILMAENSALGVVQDTLTVAILGSNHNYKIQGTLGMSGISGNQPLTRFE